MSLTTPFSVQKLQTALHAKAKESPDFRFYALYDKVYRKDVLAYAYERCKANSGAAGVDNQTFEDIELYGGERWLDELTQELKSQPYQPQPVRRVYIPKPDGKQRPLGIPTIRDRVVQTAAVLLVLEPIFEADLAAEQYAYRADRSALDAVQHVHKLINTGHGQIVDADLSSYFDSVPHAELLKSVARRIVDGAMLHLIKMWLEAPVEETDERGNKRRSTRNRDEGRGTPQGSPISPLLSNLYMRRFVLGWKKLGHEKRWKAYIVNYADDLVICCRAGAEQALTAMRRMMSKLKLMTPKRDWKSCARGERSSISVQSKRHETKDWLPSQKKVASMHGTPVEHRTAWGIAATNPPWASTRIPTAKRNMPCARTATIMTKTVPFPTISGRHSR